MEDMDGHGFLSTLTLTLTFQPWGEVDIVEVSLHHGDAVVVLAARMVLDSEGGVTVE